MTAAAVLCALALSACSKSGDQTQSQELRIAIPINVSTLNPILQQNAIESFVDGLMFDELVTIDDQGRQVPDLAETVPTPENGGISKDGLTITYHLRKDAKWDDGQPVTSDDVKYTWEQLLNTKNNVTGHHGYDLIKSIDTPDAHTVVMHMKSLFPPAVDTIFGESDSPYRIIPKHLLAKYPSLNDVPFNAEPVGSGPYQFVSWQRGDRIELRANPNYFRGAPKIDRLVLHIIPDVNTTEAQLRSGEIDLAIEVTGTTYGNLASAHNVERQLAKAPSWEALIFNTSRAPLDDLTVRQAIAYAVDKNSIVRNFGFGSSEPAVGDITDFSWAFDKSIAPQPFDLQRAKTMLDNDGWKAGPDGIRVKDGKRLSLVFTYGQGSSFAQNVSVAVQQQLRAAGVEIQLKSYQYQTLFAAAQSGGILNSGKYDIDLYAWISGTDPDNSSNWMCDQTPPAGNNIARYCSQKVDALERHAFGTFDRSKRKADYAEIERQLIADAPAAFLMQVRLRYAHTPNLKNFKPNGISEGWNANEWSY